MEPTKKEYYKKVIHDYEDKIKNFELFPFEKMEADIEYQIACAYIEGYNDASNEMIGKTMENFAEMDSFNYTPKETKEASVNIIPKESEKEISFKEILLP